MPDVQQEQTPSDVNAAGSTGGMGNYFRVFKYADRLAWTLNIVACVAAVAAGTVRNMLPASSSLIGQYTANAL